jgi:glycosyltransferase involved in cell wall biosynthesis
VVTPAGDKQTKRTSSAVAIYMQVVDINSKTRDSERVTSEIIKLPTKTVLSIVVPALNEEDGIAKTIAAIPQKELEELGYETQVLVVDNGSEDRTPQVAREAGAEVVHEPRRGYGRAYKTGFAQARGEIIATSDADHTYPVEDIPKLVSLLREENLHFITTNRFSYMENGAMSFEHRIGNGVLNVMTRLLFRIDLNDSQSGMWVFRKELLDKLVLKSDSMSFSQELKIEACNLAGCRWREIPINYRSRVGQVKLRTWRDGTGNLLRLIAMRMSPERNWNRVIQSKLVLGPKRRVLGGWTMVNDKLPE